MKDAKKVQKPLRETEWQQPIHPGEIIRRRFFEPMELTQAEFCSKFNIEPSKFSRIMKGSQKITPETATELSAAFGMSAMFFMNLQSQYGLSVAGNKIR